MLLVTVRHALGVLDFFFFNDTATTEIYTLSLHDALPILAIPDERPPRREPKVALPLLTSSLPAASRYRAPIERRDRKSTRLNSSHGYISYAVFCLKKKKTTSNHTSHPTITRSRTTTNTHR